MKLIKLAIISFVVLFLLLTAMSLFIPSTVRISRAIQLNSSKEEVLSRITDPLKWKGWVTGIDTSRPLYVEGKVVGMFLNNHDKQYLALRDIGESEVTADYHGIQQSISTGWVILPGQNAISLQWYMDFKLNWYPWEKFSSLIFEKRYGQRLESGLDQLKKIVETK